MTAGPGAGGPDDGPGSARASGEVPVSGAFERLHPSVQRWAWRQGWTELRDLQERAIAAVLPGDRDVILAAATASGKTEAAFLPVLSRLAGDGAAADRAGERGFGALYVSPLKALINDQYARLRSMGEAAGVEVHRWHGDVAEGAKREALRRPSGVLLITPESLEALLVRRGPAVPGLFGAVAYVVVDELHAFIGTERGRQLQSLLHRVDLATRRTRPRVALSATLGGMLAAAEFLRPGGGAGVVIVESEGAEAELRLQVRGYVSAPPEPGDAAGGESDLDAIADHLYRHLRGHDNLVFANARNRVERLADLLRRRSEEERAPVEFHPHHGNLSKELRETLEAALKGDRPATAVCTSTLELGIDIGSVHSVAQVGPPPSVAALRQRLGRSGRRAGEPAVLRVYVSEGALDGKSRPDEALRLLVVRTVATVELLLRRWYEPPAPDALHLSTLVQQTLAVVAQHGGARADELFGALCRRGPFRAVTPALFAELLRHLGGEGVLAQGEGGALLLGERGERLVNHHTFYAAFQTDVEYRLVHDGKALGTLPVSFAVTPGMYLVFAGRRWRVLEVSEAEGRIDVAPSQAGRPPSFGGEGGRLDGRVLEEMFRVYRADAAPVYLDGQAQGMLEEGRRQFGSLRLDERWSVPVGRETLLFPWLGTPALSALALALVGEGVAVGVETTYLVLGADEASVRHALDRLAWQGPPGAATLAALAKNKAREKYHPLLSEPLLCADYGSSQLDVAAAWARVADVVGGRSAADAVGTTAIGGEPSLREAPSSGPSESSRLS